MNLRVLEKSGQWDAAWAAYQKAGGYHGCKDLEPSELAAV